MKYGSPTDIRMTPEQWQRVKEVFEAALERDASQRTAFLDQACNGEMRREVESLLDSYEKDKKFMSLPVMVAAAQFPLKEQAAKSLVGETLGHYDILSLLGEGGMGKVYLADDTKLKRKVALKVLASNDSSDEQSQRRLVREAQAAAALDHPNICAIYEVNEINEQSYIAMQYIGGETLEARLAAQRLSCNDVVNVALQVADALTEAHTHNVIHRDIKPSNIMLTDRTRVKVLDFGLAKAAPPGSDGANESALTKPGLIIGTVPYMSPEQVRGERVDQRTDIFSFGVLLYEMVTGRPAFARDSTAETIAAVLSHEPNDLSVDAPAVPNELERIVRKCLAKDRERRYQATRDLLIDLQNLQHAIAAEGSSGPTAILPQPGYTAIAVLPLTNFSAAPDEEYFADGMTEALINELAQIRSLRVISRTSSMRYKSSDKPLPEIARELGVDTVMEGSIQRSGARVRITAQLIHAPTDRNLWARTYDRDVKDILMMQAEVAGEVAREIGGQFGSALASRSSVNPEAYDAYLRGNFDFYGWQLGKSLEAYQRAIDGDPDFAPSYARMAGCYYLQAFLGVMAPHDAFSKVRSLAAAALAKDPELAEGLGQRGIVNLHYDWDWFAAERDFKLALEIDPSNADNHHYYAHFLLAMNRPEQNVAEMQKAVSLDPQNPILRVCCGWHQLFSGDFESAVADADRASEMAPNLFWSPMVRGWAFEQQGKFVEAVAEFEKALEQSGGMTIAAAARGHALALAGEQKQAEEVASKLIEGLPTCYASAFEIAGIFVGLGDFERTFEWLQNAVRERSTWLVHVGWEPRFKPIRRDPRFADIVRAIGLPVHSMR